MTALAFLLFVSSPALAMEFVRGGTDIRSNDAEWIQAEGPIDETTVEDFRTFLDEGPEWLPKRIRFNSPGGSLSEGIQLGEELRRRGFATEVGGQEPHPDFPDMPYWDFTQRTPGVCASACAYAFMGGVERRIDPGSQVGFHQFYNAPRSDDGSHSNLRIVQEGVEQRITSLLLDYALRMGVDGRVLVNAGLSGPDEMYWIGAGEEARETGLVYAPGEWGAWNIETLADGVVAKSERTDGKYGMAVFCTKADGAHFDLSVTDESTGGREWSLRSWLVDQCLPAGSSSEETGVHRILGNRVEASDVRITEKPGGFDMRFPLGRDPLIGGSPSFLQDDAPYSACMTDRFLGNEANMQAAVRIALRNCIR